MQHEGRDLPTVVAGRPDRAYVDGVAGVVAVGAMERLAIRHRGEAADALVQADVGVRRDDADRAGDTELASVAPVLGDDEPPALARAEVDAPRRSDGAVVPAAPHVPEREHAVPVQQPYPGIAARSADS